MDFLAYLQASPVNTVALGGLVTLMVLSLIRGWVVPRSVLVDRVADKDARIAEVALERDQWKAAYDTTGSTRPPQWGHPSARPRRALRPRKLCGRLTPT
jgi:hypothetical protein